MLHLSAEEVARRYLACRSGLEETHRQVLWLLTRPESPLSPARAAAQVGLTPGWARARLKRWNDEGPDGLADRRAAKNGGKPRLSAERPAELFAALQGPPPDGGLWAGPKVAAHVHDRWGVTIAKQTGWGWLKGLGFTPQIPRPRNPAAASDAEQGEWKRRPSRAYGRASPRASRGGGRAVGRG